MAKVLLVEDGELNREILSRRLERQGHSVLLAVDGQQGIDLAKSELPDLIVMDLTLPIVDGWEATRQIKADEATSFIPIIVLTANAMSGDREEAFEAGADDFDTKPVEFDRFLGKVDDLLAGIRGSNHS